MKFLFRHSRKKEHLQKTLIILLCACFCVVVLIDSRFVDDVYGQKIVQEQKVQEQKKPATIGGKVQSAARSFVRFFVGFGKRLSDTVLRRKDVTANAEVSSAKIVGVPATKTDGSITDSSKATKKDGTVDDWIRDFVGDQGDLSLYETFEANQQDLSEFKVPKAVITAPSPEIAPQVVYQGLKEQEIRSLVEYMISSALEDKDVIKEVFKYPVSFKKGIIVEGDVDFAEARVTGLSLKDIFNGILPSLEKKSTATTTSTSTSESPGVRQGNSPQIIERTVETRTVQYNGGEVDTLTTRGLLEAKAGVIFSAPSAVSELDFQNESRFNLTNSSTKALSLEGQLAVFDTLNNRVGINTFSPSTTLDVNGTLRVVGSATFGTSSSGSVTVNASSIFNAPILIDGTTFFMSSSTVNGPYDFVVGNGQDAYFGGNTVLGDSTDDIVYVNARSLFSSDVQVGGTIYASNSLVVGTSLAFDSSGSFISSPNQYTSAFNFVSRSNVSSSDFIRFGSGTSSVNSQTLFSWGYDENNGQVATSTFTSYVSDVPGSAAHVFSTNEHLSASSTAVDRVLFAVQNASATQFFITPSGDVHTAGTFVAHSGNYGIQDIAEYVNLSPEDEITAGDAIEPDPLVEGQFRKVRDPLSPYVAGIISNTAAFVMGSSGEHRGALALSGIVRAKVVKENGVIKVGDALVSSSVAGTLMRYNPVDAKANNAMVVGTALESFDDDDGYITMLVRSYQVNGTPSILSVVEQNDATLVEENTIDTHGGIFKNVSRIESGNGEWMIDSAGRIFAREISTDKLTITGSANVTPTLGRGVILKGEAFTTIENAYASDSSAIFLTFTTNLNGRVYYVNDIVSGKSFSIRVTYPADEDLHFWYWIVSTDQKIPVAGVATEEVVAPLRKSEVDEDGGDTNEVAGIVVATSTEGVGQRTDEQAPQIVTPPENAVPILVDGLITEESL